MGNIISVIRNLISLKGYIETCVRDRSCDNIPSAAVCRRIKAIVSGSHRRSGSENLKGYIVHTGTDRFSML